MKIKPNPHKIIILAFVKYLHLFLNNFHSFRLVRHDSSPQSAAMCVMEAMAHYCSFEIEQQTIPSPSVGSSVTFTCPLTTMRTDTNNSPPRADNGCLYGRTYYNNNFIKPADITINVSVARYQTPLKNQVRALLGLWQLMAFYCRRT